MMYHVGCQAIADPRSLYPLIRESFYDIGIVDSVKVLSRLEIHSEHLDPPSCETNTVRMNNVLQSVYTASGQSNSR